MNFYSDLKLEDSESQINNTQTQSEKYADDKQKWYSKKKGIAFIAVGILVLVTGLALLLRFGASPSGKTNTQTRPKRNGGNIPTSDMSELIYFSKSRVQSENGSSIFVSDLCSVRPDGSQLTIVHKNISKKYVVSNDGKMLFYLSGSENELFSVNLTKESGQKQVIEFGYKKFSFSVNSDGSKVIFVESCFKYSVYSTKIQMIEFKDEEKKWTETLNFPLSILSELKLCPKFNGEFIFYEKTTHSPSSFNTDVKLCKIDISSHKEQCEEIEHESCLLASNGDRYAYSIEDENKLFVKTFGSKEPAKKFEICSDVNSINLIIYKWDDGGIYFSYSENVFGSSELTNALLFLNLSEEKEVITEIRDENSELIMTN